MIMIRDRDGKVISRSKNFRGIRRYVSNHVIKVLDISRIKDGAKLSILFENGSSFEENFADYDELLVMVRNWRNVQGAPLLVQGRTAGKVSRNNLFME